MDIKNIQVSRKYATAFLNFYFDKIDEKAFLNIKSAFDYLKLHNYIFQFFYLPNLSLSDKKESINLLLRKFDLPVEFKKLTDLLLKNNRIFLLIDVLREMILIYQDRASIILFDVTSAQTLQNSDLQSIRSFLERKSGKKIIESYKIDKSLIAGIRAKSNEYLWEYSIAKQLRNIEKLLE